MSLRELVLGLYLGAEAHALAVLIGSMVWALGGSLLARIGKGGTSDRDGRAIASVVIGGAVLWVVVAASAGAIGHVGFGKGLLDADILLLLSPLLCLALSVAGIRWAFPLSELATVRTLRDVGLFVLACALLVWLLSRFRGWGILFLGGLGDLLLIGCLAVVLLLVLYRRAFPR